MKWSPANLRVCYSVFEFTEPPGLLTAEADVERLVLSAVPDCGFGSQALKRSRVVVSCLS